MKADDGEPVFQAFEKSDHEIDHQHREVMDEVLAGPERVGEYELLYWLSNLEQP